MKKKFSKNASFTVALAVYSLFVMLDDTGVFAV